MRFAAKASGVEQQTLDVALQRFTRRAAEAAQGTGEAKDALASMGITLRDQDGHLRRSEDLLADVADAFARIEDPAERVRLAFKLFDSEGVALVNLLSDGSGALDQMRERARDLGIVLDEHLVRDAERTRTELDTLAQVVSANLTRAALEAAPVIADLSSWLADVAGKAGIAWERVFDAPEEKSLRTLRYELDLTESTIAKLQGRIDELRKSPTRNERVLELPVVMTDDEAKRAAWAILASAWVERDSFELFLPLAFLRLDPGDVIDAEKITEALTATIRLRLTEIDLSGAWLLRLKGVTDDPIVWQTSGQDVAVTTGGGAQVVLTAGQRRLLYGDGTNIAAVAPDFASTGGAGGGGGFPVFKGALIKRTTNVAIASGVQTTLAWESEVYDTDGFADVVAQPTRLTVPAGKGITRVQVLCCVQWGPSSSGDRWVEILKNGVEVDASPATSGRPTATAAPASRSPRPRSRSPTGTTSSAWSGTTPAAAWTSRRTRRPGSPLWPSSLRLSGVPWSGSPPTSRSPITRIQSSGGTQPSSTRRASETANRPDSLCRAE